MTDTDYMSRAIDLARRGRDTVRPNPMVGAVAVSQDQIVGEGFHVRPGEPHAEVLALEGVEPGAAPLTVYVTLEPCSFTGKTPPCADLLIQKGVTRVVCAMEDPDSRVSGSGFHRMRDAGIVVDVGVLESEARELNEIYLKHRIQKLPFVTLKLAETLDGRIATPLGDSKWISSEGSRVYAHQLRAEVDAVLVGSGTLTADDPELSVRHVEGPDPIKIVLDSRIRISTASKVFQGRKLIVATLEDASEDRAQKVTAAGGEVWRVGGDPEGHPKLREVLSKAAQSDFQHVLIEGGGKVAASALRDGLVDRVAIFISPKFLGSGIPSVADLGVHCISDAIELTHVSVEQIGDDILYRAHVKNQL